MYPCVTESFDTVFISAFVIHTFNDLNRKKCQDISKTIILEEFNNEGFVHIREGSLNALQIVNY
jgi:hypothetical protein